MKKLLLSIITLSVIALGHSKAQSTLIHYWNFNSLDTADQNLPAPPVVNADYSLIGTSVAYVSYDIQSGIAATYDSTFYDGDDNTNETSILNARFADTAGHSFRARNPSDSIQMLITFPTTGYKNIALKFATERSSKGAQTQNYDYSLDNGATWLTSGLSLTTYSPDTVFNIVTVNMASDTNINNSSKVIFRILFANNTAGTKGNDRFDNVTVEGDSIAVTPPNAISNIGASANECTIHPNPATDHINIDVPAAGTQTVSFYSVTGKLVYTSATTPETMVSVATLAPGMYFGTVTGSNNTYKFRFIKQ